MKLMVKAKKLVYDILKQSYPERDIHFNLKGSPDFILPDKRIDVKRPIANKTLLFTQKQWKELKDSDEIWIINGESIEAVVPFSEVRKAYDSGKGLSYNGKSFRVLVTDDVLRLNINDGLTKRRFLEVCKELGLTPMETLRTLLDLYEQQKNRKNKIVVY